MTETTLHKSVVTLTLSGGTYARSRIDIGDALKVSGIQGVTTSWLNVERISGTEITVELEFAGNIDTDATLTFTLGADAIVNYKGPALTTQLPVSALTEWIVASTAVPLTAATLDGSVVTLTLSGGTYERWLSRNAVKVSGMTGVTIGGSGLEKISDAEGTISLKYDGNTDRTGTLIFTIEADAIKNYEGPPLTAELAVPTQLKEGPKGDINGDGAVSIQDLILVASSFGKTGQHPADANGDGSVDIKDLILIAGVLDADAAAPALYPESLEILTPAALQLWLSQAHHLTLRDATSQRGIRFLEQLLASMVPQETLLLANYPNPFNPETWIPYQLSTAADVTLTIYAMNGQMVRRLVLGHQPAGVYQSRSRAAYWDGRNELGEPVASGVYFYQLETDTISSLRKMVILK